MNRPSRSKVLSQPPSAPAAPFPAALQMLARRAYSVAELRRALERKFGATEAVSQAIARLREARLLDDKKFAAEYASSLVRNRSFGRRRALRELKARLVDYRYLDAALDAAYQETSERDLLECALTKKLRSMRLPLTPARFYSLCQSLMRLGFRPDDIMKIVRSRAELKPAAPEAEWFDAPPRSPDENSEE